MTDPLPISIGAILIVVAIALLARRRCPVCRAPLATFDRFVCKSCRSEWEQW